MKIGVFESREYIAASWFYWIFEGGVAGLLQRPLAVRLQFLLNYSSTEGQGPDMLSVALEKSHIYTCNYHEHKCELEKMILFFLPHKAYRLP